MTSQEKREEVKTRLIKSLKQKVRKHRPAAKVIELAVMQAEDVLEHMEKQKAKLEGQLEYIKTLDPKELEPEKKS